MDVVTLHRDAARRSYFERASVPPVFFDAAISCWIVTKARDCEMLLRSPCLRMSPYLAAYAELEERSDHRFPNLSMALAHLPLCQDGDAHRQARRRLAEIISARRSVLEARLPDIVARRFAPLAPGRPVDLMREILEPLVAEVIETLTDTRIPDVPAIRSISVIFDRMTGLRKRLQIENDLGAIRALIRASLGPGAPAEAEGDRLALFILGHDTLLGTLGESLHQLFRGNSPRKLCDIDFPDMPIETGVPYVERVVAEPVSVGPITLEPGSRVRLMLQSFQYSDAPLDRARLFGVGIHACLGKQMALGLWQTITAHLARIDNVLEIVDYAIRASDFVFTCPEKLIVRLA